MHKKSIEASETLNGDDQSSEKEDKNSDDLRSESIAVLRAKAQEHSAKVMALHSSPPTGDMSTSPVSCKKDNQTFHSHSNLPSIV